MDTKDFLSKKKVRCPTLSIWGKDSHTGKVYGDLLPIWKKYVSGPLSGGEIDCGHYVIEEKPEPTIEWFFNHFNEQ